MTKFEVNFAILLALLIVGSAIAVVKARFDVRTTFAQLQELRSVRDKLDVEWVRLRIEEASLAQNSRVQRAAKTILQMHIPEEEDIRILKEGQQRGTKQKN